MLGTLGCSQALLPASCPPVPLAELWAPQRVTGSLCPLSPAPGVPTVCTRSQREAPTSLCRSLPRIPTRCRAQGSSRSCVLGAGLFLVLCSYITPLEEKEGGGLELTLGGLLLYGRDQARCVPHGLPSAGVFVPLMLALVLWGRPQACVFCCLFFLILIVG